MSGRGPKSPIREAIAGAEEVPGPPDDFEGRVERPLGEGRDPQLLKLARELIEIPEDLPIEPLGMNGDTYFYLDGLHQLRSLAAEKHGRTHVLSLFARHEDYLLEKWGRRSKFGLTGGLHTDAVSNVLMHACAKAGILDPRRHVRFAGAWSGDDGALVLHMGDRIWIRGRYERPGRYGEHVYPAVPATIRPAIEAETVDAGGEVLTMLKTWQWTHRLQATLVLGWIGQGFAAGALDWRTHMIGDGERGSGKSALLKLIHGLFGSWLLATSDTTAAALYQLMAGRGQPVFIDEFEAGDNPTRKAQVVTVLRQASSGGVVQRGGDDHVGRQFTVQFPAFLTSIAPISLLPQDESRMVRVKLQPLPEGAVPPDLTPAHLNKLGARIMRRIVDQWPRFAQAYALYRATLEAEAGFDARLQDTYGTLLACADLLLYDNGAKPDEVSDLCAQLAEMVAPARAEASADQVRCLEHLLSSLIDRGGGPKRTVASWIRQTQAFDQFRQPHLEQRTDAQRALGNFGLKVMARKDGTHGLFVSNSNPQLQKLFDDTPWPGHSGAIGAWAHVLRRLADHEVPKDPTRVGGQLTRGTIVPLDGMDWQEGE